MKIPATIVAEIKNHLVKIIFMNPEKIFISPILIDALKNISSLTHGTSPRYFEDATGEKKALLMGLAGDANSSSLHRKQFLRALDIRFDDVYLVKQVHGDRICVLDEAAVSGDGLAGVEADAIVTRLPEKPIGILTADCIPIIVYDRDVHAAGVVHAGRKGTAEKILSKTIGVLRDAYGSRPENIVAAMGPGIGGCCYEVDDLCVQPFKDRFRGWADFAKKSAGDKYRLDLFLANTEDAIDAGVLPRNIFRSQECTACRVDRYFSYRKEGTTGRLLTLAMLRSLNPKSEVGITIKKISH